MSQHIRFSEDDHSNIREDFEWTRRIGKNKKLLEEPQVTKLKDLSNNHVESLCYFTVRGFPDFINKVFVDEHNYRIDNNIVVEDY
ncbi:hypothetical protein [Vibrio phage S4-7]|nr:hypothetical protein [Vibrio phage S4-7]